MPYPGEYPQPLVRKHFINVPVVSGYVTSRLQGIDPVQPVTSGDDTYMMVTFENVGGTLCAVKLRQTQDRTISGARVDVVSGISLVPGGHRVVPTNAAYMKYLELYCYSGGPSQLRIQIESLRQWGQMGFDKVADATFYPPQLWEASPTPIATPVTTPTFP
jgi:hypothetical protein